MRRFLLPLALVASSPAVASAQLPGALRVRVDSAATDTVFHVPMPPGWHVTTGPGALLYDPAHVASGRFAIGLEVYLFPDASDAGYGVFVGGTGLDGASPRYVAFVARRDGAVAVERVEGDRRTWLVPWAATTAVRPGNTGGEPVLNAISVRVEGDSVRLEANGQRVATVPRGNLPLDGTFGVRAGPRVNLHVTNLDLTRRLAPARGTR